MNWLLGGQFSLYGFSTIALGGIPTMNKVFPKLTKCTYFKYGATGTLEKLDALCVLPLNILNEKLFIVLWFWLFFLTLVSFLALMYRTVVAMVPKVRVYLLMAQARHISYGQARMIVNKLSYGDFFVLYHIGKNLNPLIYREIVYGIYRALSTTSV